MTRPLHAKTPVPVDNKTSYDTTQQRGSPPPPIACTRDTAVFAAPTPAPTVRPRSGFSSRSPADQIFRHKMREILSQAGHRII